MQEATPAGNSRGSHGWWQVWRRAALMAGVAALLAPQVALAQDSGGDGTGQSLAVGTTVDLSTASVGPIWDLAIADETYVTIEDEGLWLLQADGKTIEKVSGPAESITALATDGSTYYLGTGDGLFVGRDGDWRMQLADLVTAVCAQTDPPLYLAGGTTAMWRSEDGQQWAAVAFPDMRVLRCVIAGSAAYAATTSGVYRSTDSGRTWTETSAGLRIRYIESLALDGDTLYAASGGGGLYVSTDHANTWAQVNSSARAVDDVAAASGALSFLSEGTLQQSTDGGETWTSQDADGAILLKAVTLVNNARAQQ